MYIVKRNIICTTKFIYAGQMNANQGTNIFDIYQNSIKR